MTLGRELLVTEVCVADELAGAAELVMGKASGIPVAIVRGVDRSSLRRVLRTSRDRAAIPGGPVSLNGLQRGGSQGRRLSVNHPITDRVPLQSCPWLPSEMELGSAGIDAAALELARAARPSSAGRSTPASTAMVR